MGEKMTLTKKLGRKSYSVTYSQHNLTDVTGSNGIKGEMGEPFFTDENGNKFFSVKMTGGCTVAIVFCGNSSSHPKVNVLNKTSEEGLRLILGWEKSRCGGYKSTKSRKKLDPTTKATAKPKKPDYELGKNVHYYPGKMYGSSGEGARNEA